MQEAKDQNPNGRVGEDVFFRQTGGPARAAKIANADTPGGPVDLVVYCSGNSNVTREAWASGHSVVTFRGLIPHVTKAAALGSSLWWSRAAEDCPSVAEAEERSRHRAP